MFEDVMLFLKEPKHLLLVLVNTPLYYLYYKLIFGDAQNLAESFTQSSQLDIVSFCKGSLLDDWWHTAKSICWMLFCYKTIALEYSYLFC